MTTSKLPIPPGNADRRPPAWQRRRSSRRSGGCFHSKTVQQQVKCPPLATPGHHSQRHPHQKWDRLKQLLSGIQKSQDLVGGAGEPRDLRNLCDDRPVDSPAADDDGAPDSTSNAATRK